MSHGFTELTSGNSGQQAAKAMPWEKNSCVTEFFDMSYYPNIEESGNSPAAPIRYERDNKKQGPLVRSRNTASDQATRDAVRRAVDRAAGHAERMIEAARLEDAMELSNAGFDLLNTLEDLWSLRVNRESNWRDLVNLLQGALTGEHFEVFTAEKCISISEVINEHLRSWLVEDDDLRSSISTLRRAGLDPWKGISAISGSR